MQFKNTRIKIVLPGEVIKKVEKLTSADGTVHEFAIKERILVPSKKNSQRMVVNKKTLKVMPMPSLQHVKWHSEHFGFFLQQKRKLFDRGFNFPIYRAKITVLFYFPDALERDLGEKYTTLADILTDTGIIYDDMYQVLKPVTLDGWCDRSRPRTEIYLTLINPKSKEYAWDITPPSYMQELKNKRVLRKQLMDRKRRIRKREFKNNFPVGNILSMLLNR